MARAPRLLGAAEIRTLAAGLDLRPTKQRGQNFVIDGNTVRRIVADAKVTGDDVVLEVGPGLGSLTLALLAVARRVVAVEVDPLLAGALPATIAAHAPDQVDAFEVVLADALRVTELPGPAPTALVANLPYNVSVPVLLHLLALLPSLERGLVMVQAEVADRLAAEPRLQDVRRPLGQGRLVRRGPPRRVDRSQRLLAGPERRLGPGRLDPAGAADHHRDPRAGVRGDRRRVRPPAQGAAAVAARPRRVGRGRRGGARERPGSTR